MASIWVTGLGFSALIVFYWFIELLTLERYYQSVMYQKFWTFIWTKVKKKIYFFKRIFFQAVKN